MQLRKARIGVASVAGLELGEDFVEVVDAGVGGEPFGGADGAFGEGAAGVGFVGEDEAVAGAGGDEGVDAVDVAGAVGGDGDLVVGAGVCAPRVARTASRRVRAVPLGASSLLTWWVSEMEKV